MLTLHEPISIKRAATIVMLVAVGAAFGTESSKVAGAIASADQDLHPHGAHLVLRSALQLAQDEVSTLGISDADVEPTRFTYVCDGKHDCDWFVSYEGRRSVWEGLAVQSSRIYVIAVDDRTGRARDASPRPPEIDRGCPVQLLSLLGRPSEAIYCFLQDWDTPGYDVYQVHRTPKAESVPKDWVGSDLMGYIAVSRRGSCSREFDLASSKVGKRLGGTCK